MKTTFLLLPLLFAGCISKQRCNELFPPSVHTEHTTTIIQRDSVIKGATVYDTMHLRDTLIFKELRERFVVKQDTSGRAQLKYWVDEYGRLQMRCTATDNVVRWVEQHNSTATIEQRTAVLGWQAVVLAISCLFAGVLAGIMWKWNPK